MIESLTTCCGLRSTPHPEYDQIPKKSWQPTWSRSSDVEAGTAVKPAALFGGLGPSGKLDDGLAKGKSGGNCLIPIACAVFLVLIVAAVMLVYPAYRPASSDSGNEGLAGAALPPPPSLPGRQDVPSVPTAPPPATPPTALPAAPMTPLVHRLQLKHYGILGPGQKSDGPAPGPRTAVVDPAGLKIIRSNAPDDAGGASGAIYHWLGISSFPASLTSSVHQAGDAKYEDYSGKHVIHVASPFLKNVHDYSQARDLLTTAYHNVLVAFLRQDHLHVLRLLPISGGIFSGEWKDELPKMTFQALEGGYERLGQAEKEQLVDRTVDLCFYSTHDYMVYSNAREEEQVVLT